MKIPAVQICNVSFVCVCKVADIQCGLVEKMQCKDSTVHLIIFTNLVRHLYYFLRTLHFTVKQLLAKCRVGHAFF